MKDWKTTTLGILVVIVSIGNIAIKLLSGAPITAEDLALLGIGGGTGAGLYHASDTK